jgi:hypothetical protein
MRTIIRSVGIAIIGLALTHCGEGGTATGGAGAPGKAGSTARMVVQGDRLYALRTETSRSYGPKQTDSASVLVFDVAADGALASQGSVPAMLGVETITADATRLFLGTPSGVDVYELGTGPGGLPRQTRTIQHFNACDPVVVDGTTAYVTLHDAPGCGGGGNELQIFDIGRDEDDYDDDDDQSQENGAGDSGAGDASDAGDGDGRVDDAGFTGFARLPLDSPRGLGFAAGKLYVCDGASGLRVIDVADRAKPAVVGGVPEEICEDVIVADGRVVATGPAGITQYAIAGEAAAKPALLSRITAWNGL